MMVKLMEEAGIAIAEHKWFSNLATKGNTGSASIFIMLDEFLRTRGEHLKAGDQVFGFVPESGRFSVAYFLLEAVEPGDPKPDAAAAGGEPEVLTPALVSHEQRPIAEMLRNLMAIWHDYRSQVFRTELVRAILDGNLRLEGYRRWMECWIPQVREGSLWMRRAVSSMGPNFRDLAQLIQTHAGEEQLDWQLLYQDYRDAGGGLAAENLRRNPGGEALNAFMHAYAARPEPIGLLGGIYIIEGTGQRIVPTLLPYLKRGLNVSSSMLKFVSYHGENDQAHMLRWLEAVDLAAGTDSSAPAQIVAVAECVADLYLQQWKFAS